MFGREEDKKIEDIPVSDILANPYQPRKTFSEESLRMLTDSIRACGIIQPVNVRRRNDGKFELVSGERRLRAAKIAGLKYIPAIVASLTDEESAVAALVENLQRENLDFFEEAEGYYSLLVNHGYTQDELARLIGKSQGTIANKIRLLRLFPQTKELIKAHNLTERHARALLRLDDEKLQVRTAEAVCERKYNVKKTERVVRETLERVNNADFCAVSDAPRSSDRFFSDTLLPPVKSAKNIRVFINTVRESIRLLKLSGVEAKAAQFDRGDYFEFVVRVPKKTNHII